ncbi:MAG: phage protein [Sulfuricella sp.]
MSTYSFMDVSATLAGPTGVIDLGYGAAVADEGISVDQSGDKNTMMIGADGEGMHSLHADKSGTVTVRLLKTSPQNAKLMAMYDAQALSSALWGQNVIVITMPKIGEVTTARSCAFKKKPNLSYKKDGEIVEWVFDSIKIDTILGTF